MRTFVSNTTLLATNPSTLMGDPFNLLQCVVGNAALFLESLTIFVDLFSLSLALLLSLSHHNNLHLTPRLKREPPDLNTLISAHPQSLPDSLQSLRCSHRFAPQRLAVSRLSTQGGPLSPFFVARSSWQR